MQRLLTALTFIALLSSCSSEHSSSISKHDNDSTLTNSSTQNVTTSINDAATQNVIYARIGNEEVSQADIDEILSLKLFDLEWVKYDLRRKALSQLINNRVKDGPSPASHVEVLIEPPMPPRLSFHIDEEQPSYGEADAPITLAVFCSYPSVHCATMTKTYDELMVEYPKQIKLVFFDYPQAFHFNAGHAARAARCANEGGKFWPYHKGLLANFDDISEALFKRLARQVNLDTAAFKTCFESDAFTSNVKANLKQAEELGFSKVPVTLVNGLFINGPRSFNTMRYYVDKELARLNILPANKLQQAQSLDDMKSLPISQLPLRLEAITLGETVNHSSAIIQHLEKNTSESYHNDDEILPSIYLVMIDSKSIVIENAGKLERIILTGDQAQTTANNTSQINSNSGVTNKATTLYANNRPQRGKSLADPNPEDIPAGLEYTFRGVISPKGETPLSRSWLTEQLAQSEVLKEHFEPAEHEVEGVKMMRLTNVKENDFYQTLGLQERDVILRVNNEWVHSGQNNLFSTLENKEEVSVVLMRKGLPVHLNYHIN